MHAGSDGAHQRRRSARLRSVRALGVADSETGASRGDAGARDGARGDSRDAIEARRAQPSDGANAASWRAYLDRARDLDPEVTQPLVIPAGAFKLPSHRLDDLERVVRLELATSLLVLVLLATSIALRFC